MGLRPSGDTGGVPSRERHPSEGWDLPVKRARSSPLETPAFAGVTSLEFDPSVWNRHPSEGWGLHLLLLRAIIGRSRPSPG